MLLSWGSTSPQARMKSYCPACLDRWYEHALVELCGNRFRGKLIPLPRPLHPRCKKVLSEQ